MIMVMIWKMNDYGSDGGDHDGGDAWDDVGEDADDDDCISLLSCSVLFFVGVSVFVLI